MRDAQLDQSLKGHMSIVEQKVRSMLAVPLQTNDRVIGLIYVDSPHMIREFTREDLNLLTVMANVAAIRIENVRLNEVEETRTRHGQGDAASRADSENRTAAQQGSDGSGVGYRSARPRRAGPLAAITTTSLVFPDGRVGILVGDVAGKGMPRPAC